MVSPRVGAVVLAGGRASAGLAALGGNEIKALADIHGRPMIHYVWEALGQAGTVTDVMLVSDEPVRLALGVPQEAWRPCGSDPVDNIVTGAEALPEAVDQVLIVSCDTPLVRPDGLDWFVRASLDSGAALCYSVLDQRTCVGPFAGVRKTWVRVREGTMAGGNLALVSRPFLVNQQARIRQAFELRKSPLALAMRLGITFALSVVLGRVLPIRVRIAVVEQRAQRLLGCDVRALVLPWPELGIDVDKPEDLEFVRALLAPRPPGATGA